MNCLELCYEKSYDKTLLALVPPEGPPWLGLKGRKL